MLLLQNCSNKFVANEENTTKSFYDRKKCLIACENELICYKFLYNNDYSIELDEKSFWGYGNVDNEFAIKKVSNSMESMIKSIQNLEKKDTLNDFTYTYAFVNNCKDTIYADYSLKKWIIKRIGKSYYYEYNKENGKKIDTLSTVGLRNYDKFFRY